MGHIPRARPTRLTVAVAALSVEALALLVFAGLDITSVQTDRVALAIGTTLFFVGYAGLQLVTARALWRLQIWARGPAVFTQLIQLGLAWGLRDANPALCGLMVLLAAAVLFGVLSRPTRRLLAEVEAEETESQR